VTEDEPRAFPIDPPSYRRAITRVTVTTVFMLSGYVPRRFLATDHRPRLQDAAEAKRS
jgi:hypothetical protein